MTKVTELKMTDHFKKDRIDRYVYISTNMGVGEIIDEFYVNDNKHGMHYEGLTSTGILIAYTLDKAIITMYIARMNQVLRLYPSKGAVPIHLLNVVKTNEKQKQMEKSEMGWNNKKKGKRSKKR